MHVEAGLRAGGDNRTPFPEELNRRLISRIACLHLAPTTSNQENLVRENVPMKNIYVTGNTGIDALYWASGLDTPFSDPAVAAVHDSDRRLVLVTAHRRENWGDGLRGIGQAVARLADEHPDVSFVLPLHPNPAVRATLRPLLEARENVLLTEPQEYGEFARLLARCHLVLTDSGGIQEEAPALGKPVLVARETTERSEGVEAGTLRARRHRPRPHRARRRHRCCAIRPRTPACRRRRTRTATAARRSASSRPSSTCVSAARRRRPSALASTGRPSSPPPATSCPPRRDTPPVPASDPDDDGSIPLRKAS